MIKIGSQYIKIGQDGNRVSSSIKNTFNLTQGVDTRFKKKNIDFEVFDIVGLICKKDVILVVFPKHYFNKFEIDKVNSGDFNIESELNLLFQVIYKYISSQKSKASKYAGSINEYESDYPFSAFFLIYTYFQQYGIYKERIIKTKKGFSGKISWKDTIKRSKKIYSNGNIIHFPFLIKQKKSKEVFISECMAFAIDYTLDRFSFLFSKKKTGFKHNNFDFINNLDYVVKYLMVIKNEVFKDINIKLIGNLIEFYSHLLENNHSRGGDIHVKINYFNLIWEDLIENYLNKYFVKVDDLNDRLIFDENQNNSSSIFSKKSFNVDISANKYSIEPDHYFKNDLIQYIFDAKYYFDVRSLNYKQYAYHNMLEQENLTTISALIIPSDDDNNSNLHFNLDDNFIKQNDNGIKIILQRVKIKNVMMNYI